MHKWYRKYMLVVGILGQFLFYSQFYTIIHHKSATNVSLEGFLCSLITVISWLIYGVIMRDKVLIISNIVGLLGAFGVVIAILIYQ
ncbi:MAG: SemiSWEET family transporter [Pseudomonadota bacterium]|nr:hypothetical protein [Alphaproteobacteria bacterium]